MNSSTQFPTKPGDATDARGAADENGWESQGVSVAGDSLGDPQFMVGSEREKSCMKMDDENWG